MTTSQGGFFVRWVPFVDEVFGHESIAVECATGLADSVRRLAAVTSGNRILKWSATTMSGFISEQYVYLLRQTTVSSGGFRLRFVGRFEADESTGGARLIGRFSFPWSAIAIFLVGFIVSITWLINTAALALFASGVAVDVGYAAATLVGVLGLLFVTRASGARDRRWILRRVEDALTTEVENPG